MIYFFWVVLALIAFFVILQLACMAGPSGAKYHRDDIPFFYDGGSDESPGRGALVAYLAAHYVPPKGSKIKEAIAYLRQGYERQGRTRTFTSEMRAATVVLDGLEVGGEWTIPANVDTSKRILFIHGGAFLVGSPISHRPITDNLARRTGCAVLAIDYRLGPENSRKDGIKDCKAGYKWLLENGPDGPEPAEKIAIAGDSAGGNLTLLLSQWTRDAGVHRPDAAVAMSPTTDSTGGSPSMAANAPTDAVLGSSIGGLKKLPKGLLVLVMWITGKINPFSADASPLFGDCHDLPPTLIQVSNTEVLYDDGCRFYDKARQAGSPVTLQVWRGQEHVWQHYDDMIPEAGPALDEIAVFLKGQGVGA